jgi:hypothetical protein
MLDGTSERRVLTYRADDQYQVDVECLRGPVGNASP